jgi:hypothetical protein
MLAALDKLVGHRDTYDDQLEDLARVLGWCRSEREKKNKLKYDGEKDELLSAVTKILHLYYHHLDPVAVRLAIDSSDCPCCTISHSCKHCFLHFKASRVLEITIRELRVPICRALPVFIFARYTSMLQRLTRQMRTHNASCLIALSIPAPLMQFKGRTMEEIEAGFECFYQLSEERYNTLRNNGELGERFTAVPFTLRYVLSDFSKADGWKPEWFLFVLDCAPEDISKAIVHAMDSCAESARATQQMIRRIV